VRTWGHSLNPLYVKHEWAHDFGGFMDALVGWVIIIGLVWLWRRNKKNRRNNPQSLATTNESLKAPNASNKKSVWSPPGAKVDGGSSAVTGARQASSGEPFVVKVKAGSQIVLGVNRQHISEEAVKQVAGRYSGEDQVDKKIQVFMFRDTGSQFPDSVQVTTSKGNLIGWILKSDSELACKVVDSITTGAYANFENSRGRPIHLKVSASVELDWDENDEDGETKPEAEIVLIEIGIKDPAEIDAD
jgi:hypothetical protein